MEQGNEKNPMIYFSSLLPQRHSNEAKAISEALNAHQVSHQFLPHTKDIWLRDFMPVQTRTGQFIAFRYEPSYLEEKPELRTDFSHDIAPQLAVDVIQSNINLDGGNIVFSPSKERVIISDRIFLENPEYSAAALIRKLRTLLGAEVIIIPSLESDFTGHADGMVRFIDENTVVGNDLPSKYGLEQRIKCVLYQYGIDVVDFPYQCANDSLSALGSYINYLETESCIFLPMFGIDMDAYAITQARQILPKKVIPIHVREISQQGGCLNCISWEQ